MVVLLLVSVCLVISIGYKSDFLNFLVKKCGVDLAGNASRKLRLIPFSPSPSASQT